MQAQPSHHREAVFDQLLQYQSGLFSHGTALPLRIPVGFQPFCQGQDVALRTVLDTLHLVRLILVGVPAPQTAFSAPQA